MNRNISFSKYWGFVAAFLLSCSVTAVLAQDSIPYPSALDASAVT